MDWSTLANIGTVIESVLVVIAAVYGYRQLREMLNARRLQSTIELMDILGSDHARSARHRALNLSADPAHASEAEWADIDRTTYAFNRVALLFRYGLLDEEMLFDMYCETIIRTWDKLQPYILYARDNRRFLRWQEQFQDLAAAARQYASLHKIADA